MLINVEKKSKNAAKKISFYAGLYIYLCMTCTSVDVLFSKENEIPTNLNLAMKLSVFLVISMTTLKKLLTCVPMYKKISILIGQVLCGLNFSPLR